MIPEKRKESGIFDKAIPRRRDLVQHAINAIWLALRTYIAMQLLNFITNLKRKCFEMPNDTYSQRWAHFKRRHHQCKLTKS